MSAIRISPLGFPSLRQAISSPTRPHSMPQNAHVERNFVQIKHINRMRTLPDKGLPKMPTTTQQPSVQSIDRITVDQEPLQPNEWQRHNPGDCCHPKAPHAATRLAMRKRLEATDTADQIRDESDKSMGLLTLPYATLLMANMRALSRNREKPMPRKAINQSTLMQEVMRRTSRSTIFLGPHPNTTPKIVNDFCTTTSRP